jgi:hypothetical protein
MINKVLRLSNLGKYLPTKVEKTKIRFKELSGLIENQLKYKIQTFRKIKAT